MTPILTALGSGISAKKILDFLMRKSPELAPKITKVLASGITAEKALSFFSKDQNFERLRSQIQSDYSMDSNANPLVQAENVRSQNLGQDPASALQRNLPGIVGGIGAAVALPFASRAAQGALSRALPASLTGVGSQSPAGVSQAIQNIANPNTPSSSINQEQLPQIGTQSSVSSQQSPVNGNNIAQKQTLPQPELSIPNARQVLQKNNFIDKVDSLIDSGNDENAVGGFYRKFNAKGVEQIEKDAGRPFEEVVKEYALSKKSLPRLDEDVPPEELGVKPKLPTPPRPTPKQGLSRESILETFEKSDSPEKITKTAIVETPKGIGEVKEIRNGKALVEVDGKIIQMLEDELINAPLPQKDLADLHKDLLEGIHKQTGKEVSRHVNWAGYDPEAKELAYQPWGDKQYIYDVEPEDVEELTQFLTQRKTTGENFIGAWESGTESPIGAAMHVLLTKIKGRAKESGKEKAHKRRYETVYSAYEPAESASKRKKDEERRRKKEEEKQRRKAGAVPVGVS